MGELAGGGSVAVAVGVYFGIGATIRTRQEFQCLPYAGFLLSNWDDFTLRFRIFAM